MKKIALVFAVLVGFVLVAKSQESPLESYVGKFKFPEGNQVPWVEVKLKDGVLFSESPMGVATLQRIEGDVFSIVEYEGVAEFVRNDDKKIIGVRVNVSGLDMEGTKEDVLNRMPGWHPLRPFKHE